MVFPVISDKNPLILASASPRRKDLLNQMHIPFIVFPSDIDENDEIQIKYVQKKGINFSRIMKKNKSIDSFCLVH